MYHFVYEKSTRIGTQMTQTRLWEERYIYEGSHTKKQVAGELTSLRCGKPEAPTRARKWRYGVLVLTPKSHRNMENHGKTMESLMGELTIHGHFQSYYDITRGYMNWGQSLFTHGSYCPYSKLRNVQSYSIKRLGLPHLWNSFLKQAILQRGNPQFPIVDRHCDTRLYVHSTAFPFSAATQ